VLILETCFGVAVDASKDNNDGSQVTSVVYCV